MINGERRPLRPFEQGEIGPISSARPRRDSLEAPPTVATAGLLAGSRSMSRAKGAFS